MPIRKIVYPLLLLLMLSGCAGAKRSTQGDIEVINAASAKMIYTRFDGERHYTAELAQPTAIAVEVKTDSGTLTLEIGEKGEQPIYSGNISSDFSFTVNAQPGTYQITAAGENHAGSYSFDWSGA